MKILSLLTVVFVLVTACNDPKDQSMEQEVLDTSQTVTDTLQPIDDNSQNIIDTSQSGESKPPPTNPPDTPVSSVKWSKLTSGQQSRMEKKSMMVITNKTKFDELWTIAFENNSAPAKPQVDFTKNSLVVLFLGEMTTGGHSIELLSIKPSTSRGYLISVRHTKPGANCLRTMAIEYPFFFALTDKISSENAEFKMSTRETKCE